MSSCGEDGALSKLIRNVAVCGDFSSGKTTLTKTLIGKMNRNNDEYEQQYKTKFYSKICEQNDEISNSEFTINLFDCPGRLETISEVNTTLRLSDGCLLVASLVGSDCLSYQSEMVLRQTVAERVKSVLMINKLDILLRSKCSLEEIYQSMKSIIESVNMVISTCSDVDSDKVYPNKNQVVFGSVLGGWAFVLKDFAKFYSKQFGMSIDEVTEKIWGDYYYDFNTGDWLDNSKNETLERGFCQFVLKPIRNILQEKSQPLLEEKLKTFGIEISTEEYQLILQKKGFIEGIIRKCFPASRSILDVVIKQLPSPKEAQAVRVENIYTGSQEDVFGRAIKNCDPDGPLMIHITRCDIFNSQVYAVGRIFSGKLFNMTTPTRILNTKFEEKIITRIVKINGSSVEQIQEATCGSIVGLQGIETLLTNTGATICESSSKEAKPFSDVKLEQTMINFSIEPENQNNLRKLIEGMELISKCYPSIKFYLDDLGGKIVSVSSEIYFHSIIKKFKQLYPAIEIKVEEPFVSMQESITLESREIFVKSPNKHNRYFLTSEPIGESLAQEIESGLLFENDRNKLLTDKFCWRLEDAANIWTFGPFSNSPNVFVDQSNGRCKLDEIKERVINGFNCAMREGPLCYEMIRGVRINMKDLCYPEGSFGRFSRGPGQILSTIRRGCHACMLDSGPILREPVLLGEFRCSMTEVETLHSVLSTRRASIKEQTKWHSIYQIKAHIPIVEYFGLSEELNKSEIFSQFILNHCQPCAMESMEELITKIRKRKGVPESIPVYTELADSLNTI